MNDPSQHHGFLLVDKPAGMTSHDVVDQLRRVTGMKKIGHAGTLDPFATGLLLMAVGKESTKLLQKFVGLDKTYEAEFVIGATTETLDPESEIIPSPLPDAISTETIRETMNGFLGLSEQVTPAFSAVKVGGKKLYELARQGKEVPEKKREIRIDAFELLAEPEVAGETMMIRVKIICSSGTYIRAIARDLGERLATTGYVQELRRTSIGPFSLEDATPLAEINDATWISSLQDLRPPTENS